MKNKLKRIVALCLATMMIFNVFCISTFADTPDEATGNTQSSEGEPTQVETIWYGDELRVSVAPGSNGYTYMAMYPINGKITNYGPYEMSSHMVTNNGKDADIPQTLMIVEADKADQWTPNGKYSFGTKNNYEVLYCCDAIIGYKHGVYYKRNNLENSDYYSETEAAHIRGIVTNSYPYVSLEQMKKNLVAENFEGAEELTRAEIITAVQTAIWAYSNTDVNEFRYMQSFNTRVNSKWGLPVHDFVSELEPINGENWISNLGEGQITTNAEVGDRINRLIDHLKNQTAIYPEKNQIIISDVAIVGSKPVEGEDGNYTVDLKVLLNNSGSSENDNIFLTVFVGDNQVESSKIKLELGKEEYNVTVSAKAGQQIKAVVSGKQILPQGVYFYDPQGGREVSQSLVGVAGGETDVYTEAIFPEVTGYTGSFHFIKMDSATKEPMENVEFRLQHDGDNCTGCHGGTIIGDYNKDSADYDTLVAKSNSNGIVKFDEIPSGHTYKLTEVTPTGYEKSDFTKLIHVSYDSVLERTITQVEGETEPQTVVTEAPLNAPFVVQNTPTYTTLNGKKVWNDNNNAINKRPENIELKVFKKVNGVETEMTDVQPTWDKTTNPNEWSWSFPQNAFPNGENGNAVTYRVEEVKVADYTTSMNKENDIIVITNTLDDIVEVSGTKTWVGHSGSYPDITINLLRDGQKINSVTLKNGQKEYSFGELPKFNEDGTHTYTYTVTEDYVPGYISSVKGFNITNTRYIPHIPTPTPTPTPTPEPSDEPTATPESSDEPTATPEVTEVPVDPTESPLDPTKDPVGPTKDPMDPTKEPQAPTKDPVDPTVKPAKPSKAPEKLVAEDKYEPAKVEKDQVVSANATGDVDKDDTPKTSDESNMQMYIALMILSIYGLCCMVLVRRVK